MKKKLASLILGCILLLGFILRVTNLTVIPIFADEAIYIHWSQIAWHDSSQRFISLTDGKPPLHMWLMIPFLKTVKDPLVAARLLSVLTGVLTVLGSYLFVQKLFNKKTAFITAFLVSISPFLLFYDRLAVADSLLTALGVWSAYLSLKLLEKPDLGNAFLLGFCWAASLLTKQPGMYFIILTAALLLEKKTSFRKLLPYISLSLFISLLGYNIIKLSSYSHLIFIRSYDYILGKKEFLMAPFKLLGGNLQAIIHWLYLYQTFIPAFLIILGLLYLFKSKRKKFIVLFSWIFVPIFISAAIGKIIFPRYFVFTEPFIIVVLSLGIVYFEGLLGKFKFIPILAVSIIWFSYSVRLIFNPVKAPLMEREQNQYLTSWSAGYGIKEIATYLKKTHSMERVDVGTEGFFGTLPDGLQVYLDGYSNINVFGVGQPLDKVPASLIETAKVYPTYFVINSSRYNGTDQNLILINKFDKPKFPFLEESLLFYKVKTE